MEQQSGLSDQYTRASPWPIPVVLGLVISEVGILFGGAMLAVAVGGLLLLAGSIVGIMRESGFADTLWRSSLGTGVVFAALGGVFYGPLGTTGRGLALVGAGVVAVAAAVALFLFETRRL